MRLYPINITQQVASRENECSNHMNQDGEGVQREGEISPSRAPASTTRQTAYTLATPAQQCCTDLSMWPTCSGGSYRVILAGV